MSVRWWRHERARLTAALCLVLMATMSCRQLGNVERIRFGREISSDGERMRLAALQPRCACVSLANTSSERVWLESWFYAIPQGSIILEPGDRRRVMFDWAGPESSDFYELVAFKVGTDKEGLDARDDGPDGGLVFNQVLTEYSPLAHMACTDKACEFGNLGMSRVFLAANVDESGSAQQRGVNVTSTIEVASPEEDRCGCVMARNISPSSTVTLRASLFGKPTGQMSIGPGVAIPIPFDWAGPLDSDVYVIEIIDVSDTPTSASTQPGAAARPGGAAQRGGGPQRGNAPAAPGAGIGQLAQQNATVLDAPSMTLRIRDYISIVGQMSDMACTPEFALFTPAMASTQPPAPAAATPLPNTIQCPWLYADERPTLNMFSAYDPTRRIVRAPAAPQAPESPPAQP